MTNATIIKLGFGLAAIAALLFITGMALQIIAGAEKSTTAAVDTVR